MEKVGASSYSRPCCKANCICDNDKPGNDDMDFNASSLTADVARALGFLTRMPVPARYFDGGSGDLSRESRAFPIAGLIAALPAALFLAVAPWLNIPALLAASIAVAIMIGTTGALHEDGLADMCDGFFGGKDPEERLDIMKDSRNGTYGTLALIMAILLKVCALSSLSGGTAALALAAASVAGRAAMVWHWVELDSARPGGVADRAGKPDEESLSFALASGTPIAVLCALYVAGVSGAVLMLALTAIASFALVRLCRDKIGGHTGDTLGAAAQIAEIAALIALASAA